MPRDRTLIASADLPLHGKRVLFCAPRNYASKLAGLLVRHGALPVWMPTIAIEPLQDYSQLDTAIRSLSGYDWISFTSRNGIEAFFDRLDALGLDTQVLSQTRVSALGNDAGALEEMGVAVDLLPSAASTRGVVEELHRRGETNASILLPVPEVIGMAEPSVIPDYVALLQGIGMKPERVPAYATRRVTAGLDTELRMILDGKLDLIAFTSVAEIDALLSLLGDDRRVLDDLTIACYGPVTANGAAQRGLQVEFIAENYAAFEGFIAAMEGHFQLH
ncbi:MAG: uroporphyrinogen-III synthase [Gammaproteobacteria bacterium]|nr:uroporphyrinogen-III synthase [Gammaproteobacteria bacterium]